MADDTLTLSVSTTDVICPTCGAQPGKACRSRSTGIPSAVEHLTRRVNVTVHL